MPVFAVLDTIQFCCVVIIVLADTLASIPAEIHTYYGLARHASCSAFFFCSNSLSSSARLVRPGFFPPELGLLSSAFAIPHARTSPVVVVLVDIKK